MERSVDVVDGHAHRAKTTAQFHRIDEIRWTENKYFQTEITGRIVSCLYPSLETKAAGPMTYPVGKVRSINSPGKDQQFRGLV